MFFFTSVHAAYMFPISLAHPSLHMIMFTEPWLTNLARVCALIYLNCGKKKVHFAEGIWFRPCLARLCVQIDKASLLAKAVERVRDLKQRVAGVGEAAPAHLFPTEHDEIVVLASGGAVFEASVCCDDRSDLLPELIETLRALRLRTLRAEMATLGGRVRNVLVLARDVDGGGVTGDDGGYGGRTDSAGSTEGNGGGGGGDFLKEALRALVERPGAGGGDRPKRRRVSNTNMQTTPA